MNLNKTIILTLQNEVKPAMGCTEPVAVALAAAKAAFYAMHSEIEKMIVKVSPNIFKNGLGVGIPNSSYIGLDVAAALGAVGGDADAGLKVLASIDKNAEEKALALIKDKRIQLLVADTEQKIHIDIEMYTREGIVQTVIENRHDHFVLIKKNGNLLHTSEYVKEGMSHNPDQIYKHSIKALIDTIARMPYESLAFLKEGIDMNLEIAKVGLENGVGIGVGSGLMKGIDEGVLSKDLMTDAMILTASASDARMSGVSMPVMSSNGSGNNGLTAILPIAAYSQYYDVSDEELVKALAISHVINCYIKNKIGRLSALCGCSIAAATGATAAISWLMGHHQEQIEGAMKNMIADVSGTICDGAKLGCALKLSTAASVAVKYALLAKYNSIVPGHNGIISESIEETIENLGRLSNEGMQLTDKVIFNIMREMKEGQEFADSSSVYKSV